jgi:hypothetical protein
MSEMIFRGLRVAEDEASPPAPAWKRPGMMYRGLPLPDPSLAPPEPARTIGPAGTAGTARALPSLIVRRDLDRSEVDDDDAASTPLPPGLLGASWRLVALALSFIRTRGAGRERAEAGTGRREVLPAFRLCKFGEGQPLLQTLGATGDSAGAAAPEYYEVEETVSPRLRRGDLVLVEAGQVIPADGEIVAGAASIDESAQTGESAAVLREAEGPEPGVRGGTRVLSGRLVVSVAGCPGRSPAAG